jgi:antitoxin YefM
MEKTCSLSVAKIQLNRLVDDVLSKDDELIITKNGQPAAALVPLSIYEGWKETQEIRSNPDLMQEIQEGIERLNKKEKRYTFKDVFGKDL